ncbi:MAG: ABC transporter substrate-binding protein [Gammaproteobacteria bacterium]|nr:MAG: ABC transporter substrate-binding protein [Gammaproteobacteria bacterium]
MKGIFRGLVLILSIVAMPVLAKAQQPDPLKVVRTTADRVLAQVTERKTELDADPSLLFGLVKDTVLPHFDFTAMTRSAMGRFWRKASPDQRKRLVHQFREMLVRTYATALLGYTGQEIEYLPVRWAEGAQKVTVQTRVRDPGGPPIPIDYRLRWDDGRGEWLVYDVVVDGVSLVTNYRSSFARLIREGGRREKNAARRMHAGIEHLIEALAAKNAASNQKKDAA